MISTKDISTSASSAVQKTLQPGNTKIKINSIYLDHVPWDADALNLMLNCEGEDLGESFEGFFVDKNDESKGKHLGQVGRVRAMEWVYKDAKIGDIDISRDLEISKMLKNLCVATDCLDWLEAQDEKHATIESLVEKMNEDAPFAGKFMDVCLSGKEYENKGGYINHDIFFSKFTKQSVPFEAEGTEPSRLYIYNKVDHIRTRKIKEVTDFEPTAGAPGDDFLS